MGSVSQAGISYTLQDLGTLPGWSSSYPSAINDRGQVAGNDFSTMPNQTAFLYSDGTLTDLGGSPSAGLGINNAGQVVGFSGTQGADEHAFLYSNGSPVNLAPNNSPRSGAAGINDKGQIAGYISVLTGGATHLHAALFDSGTVQDLGALSPTGDSTANAINASGQIVGNSSSKPGGPVHAILYSNGTMQDLGTLGGSSSNAAAINASGQIVGSAQTSSGSHAFLYSNGTMHDLGTLPGAREESSALAINDAGQIVGTSRDDATQVSNAFLYDQGTMYTLNDMLVNGQGYYLTAATGINNNGQIIAEAIAPSGTEHAVLLTPNSVPLPPAAWAALAALPLVVLTLRARKRI